MYDYLIVGAGFFGSVFAREMTRAGRRCIVVEKRDHIGGNCFSRQFDGIIVHEYGAHLFHTNSRRIWEYVSRFAKFHPYIHRVTTRCGDRTYSFPINLRTFRQVWGIETPEEAQRKLREVVHSIENPKNLEEWALAHVGRELYEMFIRGYTLKQWRRDPKFLPASILKRIPIRLTEDDRYYDDLYQGVPIGGYTPLFEQLLRDIPVELGVDYLAKREQLDRLADCVVYTGPIDAFFNYQFGELEYRTQRFDHQRIDLRWFQESGVVNYSDSAVPYTRIVEHKHFDKVACDHTIVTREYPEPWERTAIPLYPIQDEANMKRYAEYRAIPSGGGARIVFGGRLADYRYYDMHHAVGAALARAEKELNGNFD